VPDFSSIPTPPTRSVGGVGCLTDRSKTEGSGGDTPKRMYSETCCRHHDLIGRIALTEFVRVVFGLIHRHRRLLTLKLETHCGNNTWTTRSWQDSTLPDFSSKTKPSI
jgi:hypothetical protein